MKPTKILALTTLVAGSLFAGNTALQAQDSTNTPPANVRPGGPGGPGMRGRPNIDALAKELGLTDEAKAKLKTVMEDQRTKMTELRKDNSLSQEDKRAKMKEIHEATVAKLKEILTPEQLDKYQKHMLTNRPPGAPGAGTAPKKD